MIIRFDCLKEALHLKGVWRYPGERAEVADTIAQEYVTRGLASVETFDGAAPLESQPVQSAAGGMSQLFLNGQAVESFPRRHGIAVSVVIPLFRSERFIRPLLDSLENSDPTSFETIFVSDGDGIPDVPGKLIVLPERRGFAAAVNEGARHAEGRAICLLNADVHVRPNWLAPMLKLLDECDDVGAVGNRNLNRDGRIDSVGSEFDYATGNYEHLLRDAGDVVSAERDILAERDMITAACLLVRRSDWESLGGMDEAYRLGYFEDSDFCLRLREAGRRILYCPDSVIEHYKNHSGGARHPYYASNHCLFRTRWVETGLVDKFAKQRGRKVHQGDVVACYIVLNEEEFIQSSIESIYPLADRIVIVEGGNDYAVAAGLCGTDKRSMDGTIERIKSLPDPDEKIELIQGAWRDKAEQRQAYAPKLKPGDWMLLMDGDEVFYDAGLWRLSALMHKHAIIMPGFDLFWNNFETVGTGAWDEFAQVKVVRWREGYRYTDHNCPCDSRGCPIIKAVPPFRTSERLYAHYAWVKPIEKLRKKAAYYERQPGAASRMRHGYIADVFLPWRKTPGSIIEQYGSHPFGGGDAKPFVGEHPDTIRKRLERGEFVWL